MAFKPHRPLEQVTLVCECGNTFTVGASVHERLPYARCLTCSIGGSPTDGTHCESHS